MACFPSTGAAPALELRPPDCSKAARDGGSAARLRLGPPPVAARYSCRCRPQRNRSALSASSGDKPSQEAYNRAMQAYSQQPFQYQHEAGLYYHLVHKNLFVGTQPQTPADVDRLADEEGVTCIMNTQQDKDMVHWGVDLQALRARCLERGVLLERHPFPDFSADGLRVGLPAAVTALDALLECGHVVYLHCTAGMGRSPGVAIAYMYWFADHPTLDGAYTALTSVRPCGPNKEAIRNATCDVLYTQAPLGALPPPPDVRVSWPAHQGVIMAQEDRAVVQQRLRSARRSFSDPLGKPVLHSSWPLPAMASVIATLSAAAAAAMKSLTEARRKHESTEEESDVEVDDTTSDSSHDQRRL